MYSLRVFLRTLWVCVALAGMGGCRAPDHLNEKSPAAEPLRIAAWVRPRTDTTAPRWTHEETTSHSVTLALDGSAGDGPLVLCLPSGRDVHAAWLLPDSMGTIKAGRVERVGWLRRWPIGRLKLDSGALRKARVAAAARSLRLRLTWDEAEGDAVVAAVSPSGLGRRSWQRIARRLVVNPDDLDRFECVRAPLRQGLTPQPTPPASGLDPQGRWARLRIGRDGLYWLTPDVWRALGAGFARAEVADLRLFSHGRPVPLWRVAGPGAEAPPPGVYFWGRAAEGPYTRERIYWLTAAAAAPDPTLSLDDALPPDDARTATSTERQAERNVDASRQIRHGEFLSIEEMRWVECELPRGRPVRIGVDLPHLVAPSEADAPLQATLHLLIARETPMRDARLLVHAPGRTTQTLTLSNANDTRHRFDLPRDAFHNAATTLTLTLRESGDGPSGVWFDRVEVPYRATARTLDGRLTLTASDGGDAPVWTPLTAPGAPRPDLVALRVERDDAVARVPLGRDATGRWGIVWRGGADRRVEVVERDAILDAPAPEPARLDDPTTGAADFLVIHHAEFTTAAQRLAAFRREQGWRTRCVDVQTVYDAFNHGELSPDAIRRFLAHALNHWEPAPACVVALGDCSSDYLGQAREDDVRNWVPTYTRTRGREKWASDYWLAVVAGDDDLADFQFGRISVATAEDADVVIDKIVAHAQRRDAPGEGWRARTVHVADDGEFRPLAEEIRRDHTPPALETERIYLDDEPWEDNWYLPKTLVEQRRLKVSRAATTRIARAFRRGALSVFYYGHGSPNIWADERIWFGGGSPNTDNQHIAGVGGGAFVVNMTCNTGAVDYPIRPWSLCITEDMMRTPVGGAVACFVPSGPGATPVHRRLMRHLTRAMFGENLRALGEIVALSRARYALDDGPAELNYMFIFQGDPATEWQRPDTLGAFDLEPRFWTPGETVALELNGLDPPSGRLRAELTTRDEAARLWRMKEGLDYTDGRARLDVAIPADAPAGTAHLRLYAHDPATGRDAALAGRVTLERPWLRLEAFEATDDGGRVTARVANASHRPARGHLEIYALGATTHTLLDRTLDVASGEETSFEAALPRGAWRAAEARLWRALAPDDLDQPRTAIRRVALDDNDDTDAAASDTPRLRIVPDSVRVRPDRPTEGETVFIDCAVENVGRAPSAATSARLLETPPDNPDSGGRPLDSYSRRAAPKIPTLAPGRRHSVTLRWDPVGNAGERTAWIHVKGAAARPVTVRALTKSRLKLLRTWNATPPDAAHERATVKALVGNLGESDARRVTVRFFDAPEQTPEHMLADVEIKRVPGLSKIEASHAWSLAEGVDAPTSPSAQLWLKGSTQRVSSLDDRP